MNWLTILKKKKGTPWPKRIYVKGNPYNYLKQKSGLGTYRAEGEWRNDKSGATIKVTKEAALRSTSSIKWSK